MTGRYVKVEIDAMEEQLNKIDNVRMALNALSAVVAPECPWDKRGGRQTLASVDREEFAVLIDLLNQNLKTGYKEAMELLEFKRVHSSQDTD